MRSSMRALPLAKAVNEAWTMRGLNGGEERCLQSPALRDRLTQAFASNSAGMTRHLYDCHVRRSVRTHDDRLSCEAVVSDDADFHGHAASCVGDNGNYPSSGKYACSIT